MVFEILLVSVGVFRQAIDIRDPLTDFLLEARVILFFKITDDLLERVALRGAYLIGGTPGSVLGGGRDHADDLARNKNRGFYQSAIERFRFLLQFRGPQVLVTFLPGVLDELFDFRNGRQDLIVRKSVAVGRKTKR